MTELTLSTLGAGEWRRFVQDARLMERQNRRLAEELEERRQAYAEALERQKRSPKLKGNGWLPYTPPASPTEDHAFAEIRPAEEDDPVEVWRRAVEACE